MSNILERLISQNSAELGGEQTNSHLTGHEIINCCFDYYKFVFPFSTDTNLILDTTYTELFEKTKEELPHLTDYEIFNVLKDTYPDLTPGIKYHKADMKNLISEDPITKVWSLKKIKLTLEHWFNLREVIPEASNESLGFTKGFKYIVNYTPGISFMFDGPEMSFIDDSGKEHHYRTCCIELKGEGCRKAEEFGVDLLQTLNNLYRIPGCHCTRVDFATDLINDHEITFDYLLKKISAKSFSSSYRKALLTLGFDIASENLEESGVTITFGGNKSTSKLNIYDKKAEREENSGLGVEIDSWIRFEVQVFTEKADKVIKTLLADLELCRFEHFCTSLLFSHIDFKINENLYHDSNFRSTRVKTWPTDPIWQRFIGRTEKIKLKSQAKLEADFAKTRNWYNKSVIPTQTMLEIFYKDFPESRIETLNIQIKQLNEIDDKQLSIINQYRLKQYGIKDKLTYDDLYKIKRPFRKSKWP